MADENDKKTGLPPANKTWQFHNNVAKPATALDDHKAVMEQIKEQLTKFAETPWTITQATPPAKKTDHWEQQRPPGTEWPKGHGWTVLSKPKMPEGGYPVVFATHIDCPKGKEHIDVFGHKLSDHLVGGMTVSPNPKWLVCLECGIGHIWPSREGVRV